MAQNYIIKSIPPDLHTWLKHRAIDEGKTLNQLVIAILTQYKTDREGEIMNITETMLLAGYAGICRDNITAISNVYGAEIRWSYRRPIDGPWRVVTEDRTEAADIMLEYDRIGDITLDDDLPTDLIAVADRHAKNCRAAWQEV